MAEVTEQYISYDDWKELGPINRRQIPDDEIYDGTAREEPKTPYWAYLNVGGVNKLLGNPNHDYKADGFSNAQGQFFHYMNVLQQGGAPALKLIREAAVQGEKVTQSAVNIGGHESRWTAVGPDAETAKVSRDLILTALEHYPAAKGVLSQQLPKKIEDVNMEKFIADFAEKGAPKRFRARVVDSRGMQMAGDPDAPFHTSDGRIVPAHQAGTESKNAKRYSGVVGIFVDKGMAEVGKDWISQQSNKLIFSPMNAELWAQTNQVPHRKQKLYDNNARDERGKQIPVTTQVTGKVDAIAVVWNGDERSPGARMIAEATRAGKVAKVLDFEGKEMDVFAAANICTAANISKQEYARSKTVDAFSLSADEPMGRLALSLVRSEKLGRVDDKDITRLAREGLTINGAAEMAETDQGREHLMRELKLSSASIRLLGDEKVMANARSAYLRIVPTFNKNDVDAIGPESYPTTLLASGQAPNYLTIQGPVEVFRDAKNIVGVMGEKTEEGVAQRLTASRAIPAVNALASSKAIIARVEDENSVNIPVTGPQILIIASGHAHAGSEEQLKNRAAVLDAGGVVISQKAPEETGSYYDRTKKDRVGIPSTSNQNDVVRAAALLGALSNTVLLTEMDASQTNSPAHAAVAAGLKADRRPTVINHNDSEGMQSVTGMRALLMNRGAKALQRAGFGNDMIEEMGKSLEGSKLAIDTGTNMKKAMSNLVKHISGQEIDVPAAQAKRAAESDAR